MRTLLLYEQDSYIKSCDSVVKAVKRYDDETAFVLDKTVFHPQGGGQPGDSGYIEIPDMGMKIRVKDTKKSEGIIYHIVDKSSLKVLDKNDLNFIIDKNVRCEVDWERRYGFMMAHTAEHILFRSIYNATGGTASVSKIKLDVFSGKIFIENMHLKSEIIYRALEEANRIIEKNRGINIVYVEKDRLMEDYPGARVKIDRIKDNVVRLVVVDKFDIAACSGTHLKYSRELKAIAVKQINKQKNMIIISFITGLDAQRYLLDSCVKLLDITAILDTDSEKLIPTLRNLKRDRERMVETIRKISKSLGNTIIDNLKPERINNMLLYKAILPVKNEELIKLANRLIKQDNTICLLASDIDKPFLVYASNSSLDIDMAELLRESCQQLGGGGGGKRNFATGGGKSADKLDDVIDYAKKRIIQRL